MPPKGKFAELIIIDAHEKLFHAGANATLTQITETYWIIKGRQRIKSVLVKCLIFKRYNACPGVQNTVPLPQDRIQEFPPFADTRLDFAGPFFTKDNKKVYVLLFTCAVTRALHTEACTTLGTETFLLAF